MHLKQNTPMKVCLALRRGLPTNIKVGERVCYPPAIADSYARQDLVALLTDIVTAGKIQEAGGLEAYLEANPKLRVLAKQKEKALKQALAQHAPAPPTPRYAPENQV